MLSHPCANITVGHADLRPGDTTPPAIAARLNGVARQLTTRTMAGRGFTVAAMSTCGGLGAIIGAAAAPYTDRIVTLPATCGLDCDQLLTDVTAAGDITGQVAVLSAALAASVAADPRRCAQAREVAAVAALAEEDRSLRSVGELARAAAVGVRTLQRQFAQYAGVSPTWVLRRYRLLDAARSSPAAKASPVPIRPTSSRMGYERLPKAPFKVASGPCNRTVPSSARERRVPPAASSRNLSSSCPANAMCPSRVSSPALR